MSVPFVPGKPQAPPDEQLVQSIAAETGLPVESVRAYLAGSMALTGPARLAVLRSLWAPIGGLEVR